MHIIKLILGLCLIACSSQLLAYGSSSSKKACKNPVFSQFTPAHLSVVNPESAFSFKASSTTNPKSIAVSIKKQPITITINHQNSGYLVSAKLPADVGSYARVNIKAKANNNCPGTDGWLLKIEE